MSKDVTRTRETRPPRVEVGVGWTLAEIAQWCGRSLYVVRTWHGKGELPEPI